MRALRYGLVLLLPALLFGLALTAQWRTLADPAREELALRYTDPLSETAAGLQDEQDALKIELAALRGQLDQLQQDAAAQDASARALLDRLEELRAASGLSPLAGDGLVVRIGVGPLVPPSERTCLAPDLTDIVNLAWRTGAEGVAIGQERMVSSSSIYCVGSTIVVNGSIIAAPFELAIVGPQADLAAAFDDPTSLADLKRRRAQQAVSFEVARVDELAIPPYSGPIGTARADPR